MAKKKQEKRTKTAVVGRKEYGRKMEKEPGDTRKKAK